MRTSNACSPGLFEDSSTIMSYFVLGKCSCVNESNAPYHYCEVPYENTDGYQLLTHSQLIAISASSGRPRCFIFGISPTFSIYAALHPVPKMTAILVRGLTKWDAMSVPVVSLISAVSRTGRFCRWLSILSADNVSTDGVHISPVTAGTLRPRLCLPC